MRVQELLPLGRKAGKRIRRAMPKTMEAIQTRVDLEYSSLLALYKQLHQHPELSLAEKETAQRIAAELRTAGFEVTEHIGGNGVVGSATKGGGKNSVERGAATLFGQIWCASGFAKTSGSRNANASRFRTCVSAM